MTNSDPSETARRKKRHRNERIVAAVLVVGIAVLTGLFIRWNREEEAALQRDRRYIPKQQKITPEILQLQEYVRIDTTTPAGIAAGARWLSDQLRAEGIEHEVIESTPGYLNVYARVKGTSAGEGLLLFNHIDVVPPGPGWDHPPFDGVIHMNRLYGRGVIDMKALAICQLRAFVEVAKRRPPPAHDVVFLATAEEESGSIHGMQWLLRNRADIFENIAYGLTEGGVTELFSERITYFGLEIGGKQRVLVNLDTPDLDSARRLRISLEPYASPAEPDRVIPGVRNYFSQIAPTRVSFGHLLADIDRTIASGAFWRLPAPYRDLTQNTLWIRAPMPEKEGASLMVMMMNLPDEDPEERVTWLTRHAARYGATVRDVPRSEGPVPLSREDTRLFTIAAAAARERYQTEAGSQVLYRSTSDCRFLRAAGIVCYGISPYPIDFYESQSIHGKNERITLDRFMEGVELLSEVVMRWAGLDQSEHQMSAGSVSTVTDPE